MATYLVRRLAQTLPTLLGIVTLVFMMLRLLPGDPAAFIAGENVGEEALAAIRHNLGLDQSLLVQYGTYLLNIVRGNLGQSIINGVPVGKVITDALPVTGMVGGLALLLSYVIAVPLGALAAFNASKGKTFIDQGLTIGALAIDVIPGFWMALILMLAFTLKLGWFPATGPLRFDDPAALALRLVLPVTVLGIAQIASVARITRGAVLEILHEDYIRTARSLGASEWSVLFGHALKNAALPIVTIGGLSVGRLLGGTVIIETIFALPGMGTALINGIYSRDYPVVQGIILWYTLMFVLVNVLTDVLYTKVDPRVRL